MGYDYNQPVERKPRKIGLIIGIGVALMLIACIAGIGGIIASAGNEAAKIPAIGQTRDAAAPAGGSAGPAKSNGPAARNTEPLTAKDIALEVKITRKECFGSAGCIVEYEINASVDLDKLKIRDKEYRVTYDVTGLDETQTNTLVLHTDGTFDQDGYQSGQTKSSKPKLKAKVTSIEEQL